MKTLSAEEIERLLGVRPSEIHPLDILGYGYTSEGARRFRAERPDFVPQIATYVRSVLRTAGIFPQDTNPDDAGFRAFIVRDGATYKISSAEEAGVGKFGRLTSPPMSETAAICEYIRRVANPDYVFTEPTSQ